jgi:tetratricopeptide (TPR) repeat protein
MNDRRQPAVGSGKRVGRLASAAAALWLSLSLASPFPTSRALADEIVLIPGSTVKQAIGGRVRGQIQSESPDEVVVKLGTSTVNVPNDQIDSVRYDNQPATLQLAESRQTAGLLAEAAELYHKAAGEASGKPLIAQEALAREALVLTDLASVEPGRAKDALQKLEQFVRTHPKARQIATMRECQARLQLQAKDFTAAEATIAELAKLPRSTDRAAVLRAQILAKRDQHAEAIAELDRLIARFPKGSPRQREAQLAKAQSLAGLKKFSEAETLVRELILANPPEDAAVQAPAYNTLGDCLRAANRPKDALIEYLHTDLLYSQNKEEHPRALFHIAQLFRQLKQDARAEEVWQRLKQDYPRSPWLAAASAPASASTTE